MHIESCVLTFWFNGWSAGKASDVYGNLNAKAKTEIPSQLNAQTGCPFGEFFVRFPS